MEIGLLCPARKKHLSLSLFGLSPLQPAHEAGSLGPDKKDFGVHGTPVVDEQEP